MDWGLEDTEADQSAGQEPFYALLICSQIVDANVALKWRQMAANILALFCK